MGGEDQFLILFTKELGVDGTYDEQDGYNNRRHGVMMMELVSLVETALRHPRSDQVYCALLQLAPLSPLITNLGDLRAWVHNYNVKSPYREMRGRSF